MPAVTGRWRRSPSGRRPRGTSIGWSSGCPVRSKTSSGRPATRAPRSTDGREVLGRDPAGARRLDERRRPARRAPRRARPAGRRRAARPAPSTGATANDGGSTTTTSKRRPRRARSAITVNASPASDVVAARPHERRAAVVVHVAARRVAAPAALWSTLSTSVAPPAAACTEKPPVQAKTSSTRRPWARRPTRTRLSRWSRKWPVFWPRTTSASNVRPSSRNSTGSVGQPSRPGRRRRTPAPPRAPRGQAQHDALRPGERAEGVGDRADVREPRRRVGLDDERRVVAVDDEAGEPVVLAVHDAVAGRAVRRGERGPAVQRRGDAPVPPVGVDRDRVAVVQHAHADRRRRVVQADGGEPAAVVEHDGEVARRTLVADRRHGAVEHPRVAAADLAQRVRGQAHGDAPRRTATGSVGRRPAGQPSRRCRGVQQAVDEALLERPPRRLDDVRADADRGPVALAVGGVEQHPGDGARRPGAVEDAHLEVGEVDPAERRDRRRRGRSAAPCRWR